MVGHMAEVHTTEHRSSEKLRGRERRSLNLSTKLTAIEARIIEDAATRAAERRANGRVKHG